jgi:hypothetical protein
MARISKARAEIADYERERQELGLAEPVTKAQLRQLRRVGYRGPTPCSAHQAKAILLRLKKGMSDGA